ncbi:MAG: hypothetical protein ABJB47_18605, partial [Actinomycetota bacterium]
MLAPGDRAALPLLRASQVTVVVAAARHLHLLATASPLPLPQGQEVQEQDAEAGLAWAVRFYDPVVLPALALIDESHGPAAGDVRRVLGVADVIYHLSVAPGGGLTPHHAQHAGTGLANQHAAAVRDADTLRAALRGREELVDEFAIAERLGMHHTVRLLAAALAPGDPTVARAIAAADPGAGGSGGADGNSEAGGNGDADGNGDAGGDGDAAIRRALVASVRAARRAAS